MYLPTAFAETDADAIAACMRAHPLALLVVTGRRAPGADPATPSPVTADPVPFHVDVDADGGLRLVAHVARANPLWREADPAADALVVFQGPQAYVSPSWYASKAAHGQVVPTWNYLVVQARGPLVVHDDPAWVHALVTRLTDHHEAAMPAPWAVSDAPADYVARMTAAIVGLEIPVRSLVGKAKLSQNRSAADRDGVAAGLAARDDPAARAVARAMAARSG